MSSEQQPLANSAGQTEKDMGDRSSVQGQGSGNGHGTHHHLLGTAIGRSSKAALSRCGMSFLVYHPTLSHVVARVCQKDCSWANRTEPVEVRWRKRRRMLFLTVGDAYPISVKTRTSCLQPVTPARWHLRARTSHTTPHGTCRKKEEEKTRLSNTLHLGLFQIMGSPAVLFLAPAYSIYFDNTISQRSAISDLPAAAYPCHR